MGGSLFGYYLDGSKQRHFIDAAAQYPLVSRLQIDLPDPGAPYSRINAFPINEGAYPSRLGILTQDGTTTNYYNLYYLIADHFQNCFTDLQNSYAPGTAYSGNIFPGYKITTAQYPEIIKNNGGSGVTTTIAPWTTSVNKMIAATPSKDRSTVYIIGSQNTNLPSYIFTIYSFTPTIASISPPDYLANAYPNSCNFIQISNNSHSYLSTDPLINQFQVSTFIPDGSQTYLTSSIMKPAALPISNFKTINSFPIVRMLQDGSTLALINKTWHKVISFDATTGLPSDLSPPIPTGSMIFDYDYTDGLGEKWMVFSETFVQPVAPDLFDNKNKDNLVMRAWRIKQSDLIL